MFTDSKGRTWHVMERLDGSICVYYTINEVGAHFVVYDSSDVQVTIAHSQLDNQGPRVVEVIRQMLQR